MTRKSSALLAYAIASSLATVAHAHISLEMAGGPLKSRSGDGSDALKGAPCGKEGSTRGTNVYTFEPGATISLKVKEYVYHPGYFRIAFDPNGDSGFMEPQSIDPKNRQCMANETRCGKPDFCNSPTVLWDDLNPHWPPVNPTTTPSPLPTYEWQVKLPDVECDKCTIQIIQVMTDPAGGAHGPYDLKADLYHQCIDVVLKRGAGSDVAKPTMPVTNMGMDCKANAAAGAGGAAAAGNGGTGGASGAAAGGATSAASGGSPGAATGTGGMAGVATGNPTGMPVNSPSTAGSTASGVAGASGQSSTVMTSRPTTVATGGTSAAPLAPPMQPVKKSGCNVGGGLASGSGLAWLSVAWAAALIRQRRRR